MYRGYIVPGTLSVEVIFEEQEYAKANMRRCGPKSSGCLTVLLATEAFGAPGVGADGGGSVVHKGQLLRAREARTDHI